MFIVIEGLDGAGKSTQVQKLKEYFEGQGKSVKFLHFPRFDAPVYGSLVAKFLRGDLGAIDQVDPYLVALIYAGDRAGAAQMVRRWLANGEVVIMDRYVLSNIAYQCAKQKGGDVEKRTLKEWILELEYTENQIPEPDQTLFLNVPFSFTTKKLTETRSGDDRNYLDGAQDIHEASLTFQEKVREVYLGHTDPNYHIVDCATADGAEMLPIDQISQKIINIIENNQ